MVHNKMLKKKKQKLRTNWKLKKFDNNESLKSDTRVIRNDIRYGRIFPLIVSFYLPLEISYINNKFINYIIVFFLLLLFTNFCCFWIYHMYTNSSDSINFIVDLNYLLIK